METVDYFANFDQMSKQRGYIVRRIPDFGRASILLIWVRHNEVCMQVGKFTAYAKYYQVEKLLGDVDEMESKITDDCMIGKLVTPLIDLLKSLSSHPISIAIFYNLNIQPR